MRMRSVLSLTVVCSGVVMAQPRKLTLRRRKNWRFIIIRARPPRR